MGWQSLCCDLQVRHRNALLFSVMVLLWGLNWSIMKIGLRISPPFAFTSHRLLLSSMFLLALGIVFKPRIQIDSKTVSRLFVYSLVSIPSFASTIPGLHLQSSGIGAVLTYTQPIMVSIMAVTFLNESFSVLRFVGTLLGFSGVADLFLEDTGSILSWASLLLLIGAFLWGVGTIYYKVNLQSMGASFVNLFQASIACLTMYALSLLTEPAFRAWDWGYLAILVYSGIGASGIGMTIWLFLLKDEEATSLSSSSLIVPVIALFFGWLVLGEGLSPKSLAGSTLVLTGIYLVSRYKPRQNLERNVNHQR